MAYYSDTDRYVHDNNYYCVLFIQKSQCAIFTCNDMLSRVEVKLINGQSSSHACVVSMTNIPCMHCKKKVFSAQPGHVCMETLQKK